MVTNYFITGDESRILFFFRYLAESYSFLHKKMADPNRKPCDRMGGDNFGKQDGITNGGAWYSVGRGRRMFICLY